MRCASIDSLHSFGIPSAYATTVAIHYDLDRDRLYRKLLDMAPTATTGGTRRWVKVSEIIAIVAVLPCQPLL